MQRIFLALIVSAAFWPASASANPFDEFKSRVAADLLKPFALDVGGLLGSADFHSARTLSFPGFDVGLVGALQAKPEPDDRILTAAGIDSFGLPLLQVSAGLPVVPLNLSLRGLSVGGATFVGGGLKWGLYKSGLLIAIPDVAVNLNYDTLSHDAFKLNHLSGGVQASFNIPVLKPFVGIGFDNTKIEVKDALTPALNGLSATAKGMRAQVGATMSPLPLLYIFGAYNILHGQNGFSLGMGARFGGLI